MVAGADPLSAFLESAFWEGLRGLGSWAILRSSASRCPDLQCGQCPACPDCRLVLPPTDLWHTVVLAIVVAAISLVSFCAGLTAGRCCGGRGHAAEVKPLALRDDRVLFNATRQR